MLDFVDRLRRRGAHAPITDEERVDFQDRAAERHARALGLDLPDEELFRELRASGRPNHASVVRRVR